MKVVKNIIVPTGNILIGQGEKGLLEFLSLGDYGKDKNIKADFMGLNKEIYGVEHSSILPLSEKWVITISSQYGCSIGCKFCDVPKVDFKGNASFKDLTGQVLEGLRLHPEIETTRRLNIHFARMGEPTYNPNVLDATKWLKDHIDPEYKIHPVVSTMMPKKNIWLKTFIHTWMRIKNRLLHGEAGLQISLNSTSETERNIMFNNNACTLEQIGEIMKGIIPNGRKITLNFALCNYEINPEILLRYFDPDFYMCKITPMHVTNACEDNRLITPNDGYNSYTPYRDTEESLKKAGYDVIVFIPSKEEDRSRITCGNAILAATNFNADKGDV